MRVERTEGSSPLGVMVTHHVRHNVIICMETLTRNRVDYRDYWVTLRGTGDRLSQRLVLVGVVQDGLVTVGGPLQSSEVVSHLQKHLDAAWEAYKPHEAELRSERNRFLRSWGCDAEVTDERVHGGPLAFLADDFPTCIRANYLGGGVGRFFICISHNAMKQMRRDEP